MPAPPLPLPPLRPSPSLPSLFNAANADDSTTLPDNPCALIDAPYAALSQPSTPDRLLFPTHVAPTPPLTPSSASTTANSNAWRSPTSPLTAVPADAKLAAADEPEHALGLGLGLGLGFDYPLNKNALDEDRVLRIGSLSLGEPTDTADLGDRTEGRYLLVRGVPRASSLEQVHNVFTNACARAADSNSSEGPLRGICVRLLASHGIIVLAFHDPRQLASAEHVLRALDFSLSLAPDANLVFSRIGESSLRRMLAAQSPTSSLKFIAETEGVLLVCVESSGATNASTARRPALEDVASIRLLLEGFGDLRVFEDVHVPPHVQAYKVEYFDSRRGAQAREKLDGRSLFGTRLRVLPFSGAATTATTAAASTTTLIAAPPSQAAQFGSGVDTSAGAVINVSAHATPPSISSSPASPAVQSEDSRSLAAASVSVSATATVNRALGAGTGSVEESQSGEGHAQQDLFARFAFPPLPPPPLPSAPTTTTGTAAATSIASVRSQPASPLGTRTPLSPLSTHYLLGTTSVTTTATTTVPQSPSSPSSPLGPASPLWKDREMLAALGKASLPSSVLSSALQQHQHQQQQQQQAGRRISTGSLVLASNGGGSGSGSSSSGTVTANVSPSLGLRALSPSPGAGVGDGAPMHSPASEQDLRRRAAMGAALQAQVASGSPSAAGRKLELLAPLIPHNGNGVSEMQRFPLEEDEEASHGSSASGGGSPLEQTTFPSIWQSPRGADTMGGGEDAAPYWEGEAYPPPGPYSFPETIMEESPTTTAYAPSPYVRMPPPAHGEAGPMAHPAFMQVQVPMTPVQRQHQHHTTYAPHASAFGMLSPPHEQQQQQHAHRRQLQQRGVHWVGVGAGSAENGESGSLGSPLSPPSLPPSAQAQGVFTPPRFGRAHQHPQEALLSPLSPVNMFRGPTPFNTPAGPLALSSSGSAGPYVPRARQHPPPHAHPHPSSTSSSHRTSSSSHAGSGLYTSMRSPSSPSSSSGGAGASNEKNQIDLERIAAGLDTRTTVMIKNIPNKLSDRDLVEYIGKVCPRKIDFLYLRMDFQNGCNVGYAFVNFIHVEDLLLFASSKLGVKWNMFSSEKVLQMSYANYQGKEALVEKFKNSCVMDEREAWRPKIFYSSGARQGLPEPFPSPTHLRRKERSSQNRGALFVPSPPPTTSASAHPVTTGMGRLRGWVMPSAVGDHGGHQLVQHQHHGHGHESLAPAPSLT